MTDKVHTWPVSVTEGLEPSQRRFMSKQVVCGLARCAVDLRTFRRVGSDNKRTKLVVGVDVVDIILPVKTDV